MAFRTFAANFLQSANNQKFRFEWPRAWFPERECSIDELLLRHADRLMELRGTIDVIAGGPPCQGFSFAGRRDEADPRNKLFLEYVKVVKLVKPKALIVENVPGMAVVHSELSGKNGQRRRSFFEKLKDALRDEYDVEGEIVNPVRLGVPQKRERLIVIGIRRDLAAHVSANEGRPGGVRLAFHLLQRESDKLLAGLEFRVPATASDAISDLEIARAGTKKCEDIESPPGFLEPKYSGPRTAYQRLMQSGHVGPMDSARLANHSAKVSERFRTILEEFGPGYKMGAQDRERFGLLKHRVCTLDANAPARTITTLPDDILHYSEPRILSVRECARLQSFPDWFVFRGKYTTGGSRRKVECPRYTQVGNAVPPLLGRAVGLAVAEVLEAASKQMLVARGEVLRMAA